MKYITTSAFEYVFFNFFRQYILLSLALLLGYNQAKAQNFHYDTKAVSSSRNLGAQAGSSVSISGDYAILGSQNEGDGGAAHIYKKTGTGTWVFHQKITANVSGSGLKFGASVNISGDYMIVGAPQGNSNKGAAYVFERNSSNGLWENKNELIAPDGANSDLFGISVSITSAGYAVVGAQNEDEDANNANTKNAAGAAYVYERSSTSTNWEFKQKIVADDRTADDQFGTSVSISNDRLVVGAQLEDASNFGAAYIFERDGGGTWIQAKKITALAADRTANDEFGFSVAIEGDLVVVGALNDGQDNDTGSGEAVPNVGAAYVFSKASGSWTYIKKLISTDRGGGEFFGNSVAISGKNIIIGSRGNATDATGTNYLTGAGAAHIFHLNDNNEWVQAKKLVAKYREASAAFGNSVAISGDYAIAGAPLDNTDASGGNGMAQAGAAYILKNNTFNAGLNFDGTDDHVVLPNEANFDVTDALTIECWVKFNGTTQRDYSILTKGSEAWRLYFEKNSDMTVLHFSSAGGNISTPDGNNVGDGNWHHVAIVFEKQSTLKMYIDGTLQNSTASTDLSTNNDPVWIGGNVEDATYLKGDIDDVRIWKTAKSATDIANNRNCELSGAETCLLAYYKFNEGIPGSANTYITQATDATGNNTGALTGFGLNNMLTSNYVDADESLTRSTACNFLYPKIEITGNGNAIINGNSPSTSNNTEPTVDIGSSVVLTYTIKNTGTTTLNLSAGITTSNTTDYAIESQPATTIAAGGFTTFNIKFTPSTADGHYTNIAILSNDCANGTFTMVINGVGKHVPEINLQDNASNNIASNGTFDMGSHKINSSTTTQTFVIQNLGTNAGLTLNGSPNLVNISGSSDFTIATQPGSSVAASGSTSFIVQFSPTSAGSKTATLTIPNDDSDEAIYTINLTAQVITPEINIKDQAGTDIASNGSVNMGAFTLGDNTIKHTFTIENTSAVNLTLSGSSPNFVTISGDASFSISTQPSGTTIPGNGTATFEVSFKPSSTGSKTAVLSIANDDADENPYVINLTGTASAPATPEIALMYNNQELASGETITIDTTAAQSTRSISVYVKNQGLSALSLTGSPIAVISGTDKDEFSLTLTSTSSTVASNDSTLVTVNFSPVSTALGSKTAVLTINSNDSNESSYMLTLTGVSIAPPSQPSNVAIEATTLPANTTQTTRNALTITWEAPTDITNVTGYRIKRSEKDANNFQQIVELSLTENKYLDLNLAEGIQYYYQVYSYNQYGESAPGTLYSLVYVGTEEEKKFAHQTIVFPNPTPDKIRVNFPSAVSQDVAIKVYNALGKLVKTKNIERSKAGTQTEVDLTGLPAGKYLVRMAIGTQLIYKHIVKH